MWKDRDQIYIVDDDESVRRALGVLLGTFGFKVRTFSSSEEFFSAVPNSTSGCLILDMHMPGLNGWTTLQRLYRSGSKRPIIIITVDMTEGLKELVLKTGVQGFFHKPVNGHELVDLINKTH